MQMTKTCAGDDVVLGENGVVIVEYSLGSIDPINSLILSGAYE